MPEPNDMNDTANRTDQPGTSTATSMPISTAGQTSSASPSSSPYSAGTSPAGGGASNMSQSGMSQGGLSQGASGEQGQPGMSRRGRAPMSPWDLAMSASPFGMMRQFADEMDRLFESLGFPSFGRQWPGRNLLSDLERRDVQGGPGQSMAPPQPGGGSFWAPQIEVSRRGDELVVCADLPGMKKEDIHVEVRDDQLILQGERRWEQEQGGENEGFYRSERRYGRFFRAVPLPDGVDPEQARANFKDGVLEIKMPLPPQQQEQRGRRIEIG